MAPRPPHAFDERSRPDFRDVFGDLAARSSRLDVALTRIRLSTLDLTADELRRVQLLRLLLSRVSAPGVAEEVWAVRTRPERAACLRQLLDGVEQGWIDIRAAPLAGWSPDFTVFHRGRRPTHVLLGDHWFERPFPRAGPALATLLGARAAALAGARFEETWQSGHDIRLAMARVVQEVLSRHDAGAGGD